MNNDPKCVLPKNGCTKINDSFLLTFPKIPLNNHLPCYQEQVKNSTRMSQMSSSKAYFRTMSKYQDPSPTRDDSN